ncbi:MAG: hypothetical protein AAF268_06260 [Cyanobacteria bacterium P01_A01_bin.3]
MTEFTAFQQAITYLLKLVVLTLALSIAVKYGGPYLHVPEKPAIALAILLTPAAIVSITLVVLQNSQAARETERSE